MHLKASLRLQFCLGAMLALDMYGSQAQERAPSPGEPALGDSVRQLQIQIQQLQVAVQEIKEEAEHYRAETLQLRHELEAARSTLDDISKRQPGAQDDAANRGQVPANPNDVLTSSPTEPRSLGSRVEELEEGQQLLSSQLAEQYQTKVESGSKYRVRLSGMLLFNLFSNTGNVDHIEVPGVALVANPTNTGTTTGGSFAATFRQSQVGLEVYGPTLAGAKTEGNFVADLFGEFPETVNGSAAGMLRFRTGTIGLRWERTAVVAGMDSLFFSPIYPTSFASVGIPPLSYSGNLWAWIPQLRLEQRLVTTESSTFTLSGGIFDPLTGETPMNEFLRFPGAGESSRQPGYGARLEWSHKVAGQQLTLGVGGYYNRENWGFNRNVNGWAATTDWSVPFGQYFRLSGKFFSGLAIGGLGGGVGRSVLWDGPLSNPGTSIRALHATGGWGQLTFKPLAKLEFNAAAGQDGAEAGDLRGFNFAPGYITADVTRNRSEFANFIYRPRSNLLFSTEFRDLRTFLLPGESVRANQLNLIMGVLF